MKIKKVLKVLLIIVLVIATVVGTAVLFFNNINKNKSTTVSISAFIQSESKITMDQNLASFTAGRSDDGDDRFEILLKTNANLNDSLNSIVDFYFESNTQIVDRTIADSFNSVNSKVTLLNNMFNEYELKTTSSYFNKTLGANDLYKTLASYLVEYANLTNLINKKLDDFGVNKNVDAKFSMIDLYCNSVNNDLSNTTTQSNGEVVALNTAVLDVVNSYFKIENAIIVFNVSNFSIFSNDFIKYYNLTNTNSFAKNFATNFASAITYDESLSNELKAMYFYKKLYNI